MAVHSECTTDGDREVTTDTVGGVRSRSEFRKHMARAPFLPAVTESGRTRYRVLVVLAGIAAAGCVAPPVAVLASAIAGIDAALAVTAVGILAFPSGILGAGRLLSPSRPESVGNGGTPVVLVGLPATYGGIAVATGTTGAATTLTVPMGVGSVVGGTTALGAILLARALRAERAISDADDPVEFHARAADRPSWWVRTLGIAGGGAVLVAGTVLAYRGAGAEVWAPILAFGTLGTAVVVREHRPRRYVVTDRGLVRGRRLVPWSAFEAHALEGDSLVLFRSGFRADLRFDRTGIADEESVRSALDRHVPAREPGGSDARR